MNSARKKGKGRGRKRKKRKARSDDTLMEEGGEREKREVYHIVVVTFLRFPRVDTQLSRILVRDRRRKKKNADTI